MSKKSFRVAIVRYTVIVGVVLLLTGCLDTLQTVTIRGNRIDTTIRLTFSKSIIEGGAAMSGEEPDYSDLPEFTGEDGIIDIDVPGVSLQTRSIDTANDIGTEISASYNVSDLGGVPETERFFLPEVGNGSVVIVLPPNDDAGEMDEMTRLFFGSARYRILIDADGELVQRVSVNGDTAAAVVTSVGDVSYVEIPLEIWMQSATPVNVELYF